LIGSTILKSAYRFFRYHVGSAAFGSLILAIVQSIKLILKYFEWQAEKFKGKTNTCIVCMFKCLICCVNCCESCIKFISKHAYIEVMLTGKNFCESCKSAMQLITSNTMRFGIVTLLGDVFIFIGKLFICILATLIGYLIITKCSPYSTTIYSATLPTVAFFIMSYCVAELFMLVYGMAINAILHCYCLDETMHQSNPSLPQYTPDELKKFLANPEIAKERQSGSVAAPAN